MKFKGVGNRRDDVTYFPSLAHFRRGLSSPEVSGEYQYLLCQSFIDEEFVDCEKPKVFFTKEPPQLMERETLELMESDALRPSVYSYQEPAISERMFFSALPRRRYLLSRRLGRSLRQPRDGFCCIINRYAENPALNLLQERIRFVSAMGTNIDIYGRPPWSGENKWARFPGYRGPARDKLATMRRYTFALTFENTDLDGYISEKIFDALCAGAIPLYWGGGSYTSETIPGGCYIDCRGSSAEEVVDAMQRMSVDEVVAYRRAGLDFLRSPAATRFTWRYFADAIVARFMRQSSSDA